MVGMSGKTKLELYSLLYIISFDLSGVQNLGAENRDPFFCTTFHLMEHCSNNSDKGILSDWTG